MQDNSHADKVEYIQLGETLNTPRNRGSTRADPPSFKEPQDSIHGQRSQQRGIIKDDQLQGLRRQFDPTKQLRKLLFAGFSRWLVTIILILCLYATLWHYSSKTVMSSAKKRQFNALITGLSICLGLNIASSLKAMAIELRWWILSRRKRPLHEVDLILHSDSLSHLIRLGITARRFTVLLTVMLWLLLNIAAQIGVATLGLTYSVDAADSYAITVAGNVSIPDMSQIFGDKFVSSISQSQAAVQYTANSYGTIALSYSTATTDTIPNPGVLWTALSPLFFCASDYCQYVFTESSPTVPGVDPISITTNRTINSMGTCNSWPVIEGGNGTTLNITIMLDSSGEISNKAIPVTGGEGQTTYITNTNTDCGPGCSRISAFEASAVTPWYYECNVMVGNVTNSNRKEHEVGAHLTRTASGAIALQGYAASSLANNTDLQFQLYPAESIYGAPQNGSTEGMGLLMAEFAIGVVGVAAQYNPFIIVPGEQPQAGVTLNVTLWKYVHLSLALIGGMQLVLFIMTAFLANKVVVKNDSHLVIARLLGPIVERLGTSGSIASGKDICDVIGDDEKFVYSVQYPLQGGLHRLDIGSQSSMRTFPKGLYE